MIKLKMISFDETDATKKHVVIDDDPSKQKYGGYGTVFPLLNDPTLIVKRLNIIPPEPLCNIRNYTAHITKTKGRFYEILQVEECRQHPRQFIIDYISEILDYSLSTHWAYELSHDSMSITAVWFLQKHASGKPISEHFNDLTPPPPSNVRIKIARDVVNRMRTLRRVHLVHMDCVCDNIFYNSDPYKVTFIDLDGCGIIKRKTSHEGFNNSDEWEHFPRTLGRTKGNSVRPPPWYPQACVKCNPHEGNYLFGERWSVLDTVIRILTWNKISALGWLDNAMRSELTQAYKRIEMSLGVFNNNNPSGDVKNEWSRMREEVLGTLARKFHIDLKVLPSNYWINNGHPGCLVYFSRIAQDAYFQPRVHLGNPNQYGSFYDEFLTNLQ